MLLVGLKNISSQAVATDGFVNFGNVYRKYCKKCNGVSTFATNGESVSLNQTGIYHLTITAVGTGDVAGDVTLQLFVDGEAVSGAFATETITTATTEFRTFVIYYYILVNSSCILNQPSVLSKTISVQNTGVDATFTSVVLNVERV